MFVCLFVCCCLFGSRYKTRKLFEMRVLILKSEMKIHIVCKRTHYENSHHAETLLLYVREHIKCIRIYLNGPCFATTTGELAGKPSKVMFLPIALIIRLYSVKIVHGFQLSCTAYWQNCKYRVPAYLLT